MFLGIVLSMGHERIAVLFYRSFDTLLPHGETAMIYALNVFNLVPGREDDYRDYSVKAGKIIYGLGGRVVSAGTGPLREMHGDTRRRQLIVVEFPSLEVFEQFIDEAENQNIHRLREESTTDYIWTLYEPWDLRTWVKQAGGEGRAR
jgi:uncharacterized protein (DUF1330 family)